MSKRVLLEYSSAGILVCIVPGESPACSGCSHALIHTPNSSCYQVALFFKVRVCFFFFYLTCLCDTPLIDATILPSTACFARVIISVAALSSAGRMGWSLVSHSIALLGGVG